MCGVFIWVNLSHSEVVRLRLASHRQISGCLFSGDHRQVRSGGAVRHLRPLILKDVAEVTNLHESTLSRVTANKNMMMPCRGFELRHFFSVAIASVAGGDAHSSTSVRDRIRELIEDEAPLAVLSDDAIVDILRKNGIDIAWRTVAKY